MHIKSVFATLGIMAATLTAGATVDQGGAMHPFAYDVTVDNTVPHSPIVHYKLNAPATSVSVVLKLNGSNSKTEHPADPTALEGSVQFHDVITSATGQNVTVEVQVRSAQFNQGIKNPARVNLTGTGNNGGYFKFCQPGTVAINNCTESPTFGRVLVSEGRVDGTSYYSRNSSNGYFYAFDPRMEQILNNGQRGYNAGLSGTNNYEDGYGANNIQMTFNRMRYTADGRLFMMSSNQGNGGLFELNPDNLNDQAYLMFAGTRNGMGEFNYNNSWIGGSGAGLAVYGSGPNLKVAITTSCFLPSGSESAQNLYIYSVGNTLGRGHGQITTRPSLTMARGTDAIKYFTHPFYAQLNFTADGTGITLTNNTLLHSAQNQSIGQFKIANNALTATAYADLPEDAVNGTCAMAYNKDHTLLAVHKVDGNNSDNYNNGRIEIYRVNWNNIDGAALPNRTLKWTINDNIGVNVLDLAWDYANNLYTADMFNEAVRVYALPQDDYVGYVQTTPAASQYKYFLRNPNMSVTANDGTWQRDNTGAWHQEAKVTWSAAPGATAYNVYRDGVFVEQVAANGEHLLDMTIHDYPAHSEGAENLFTVAPVINGVEGSQHGNQMSHSSDFGTMSAAGTFKLMGTQAMGKITWSAPQYGTVASYTLQKYLSNTDTWEDYSSGLGASTKSYIVPNDGAQYRVVANMTQVLWTSSTRSLHTVVSPTVTPVVPPAPVIDHVMTHNGTAGIRVDWHQPATSPMPVSYELWRDGTKRLESIAEPAAFETGTPGSGTLTYTVYAVYADGGRMPSNAVEIDLSDVPYLTFHTVHNDAGTELTYLEGTFSYPGLSGDGDFDNYWLTNYEDVLPELLIYDTGLNLVHTYSLMPTASHKYMAKDFTFNIRLDDDGEALISLGEYVAQLHGGLVDAGGYAYDIYENWAAGTADYPASIGDARVQGFKDANQPIWRVDIDFDRAQLSQYPDPVSRFELAMRGQYDDDADFADINNLRIMHDGHTEYSEAEVRANGWPFAYKHAGYVPGDYRFGNETPTGRMALAGETDKAYTNTTVEADAWPAVAYHVVTANPSGNVYLATAVYGITNPKITKRVSTAATLAADDFVSTGIADVAADAIAPVRAYPVPCRGTLTVDAPQAIEQITVTAITGATVASADGNGQQRQTIDLGALAPGVYLLQVNRQPHPVRIVVK